MPACTTSQTLSCTRLPFAHHLLSRLLSSELEAAGSRWEAPSISVRPLRLFRCSRRREDRALGSTLRRTRRTRAAQRGPGRVLGTGSPPRRGVANRSPRGPFAHITDYAILRGDHQLERKSAVARRAQVTQLSVPSRLNSRQKCHVM